MSAREVDVEANGLFVGGEGLRQGGFLLENDAKVIVDPGVVLVEEQALAEHLDGLIQLASRVKGSAEVKISVAEVFIDADLLAVFPDGLFQSPLLGQGDAK